jgi:hypothetical protein
LSDHREPAMIGSRRPTSTISIGPSATRPSNSDINASASAAAS